VEQGTEQNFAHAFACCSFHLRKLKFLAAKALTAKSPGVKSKRDTDAAGHKCFPATTVAALQYLLHIRHFRTTFSQLQFDRRKNIIKWAWH
jgi:hypothetical protein